MENTLNTQNTTEINDKEIIDTVKKTLSKLDLAVEWAAKQMDVTGGYLRKIFSGDSPLTKSVKMKLLDFIKKLEKIDMILKAA